MIKIRKGQAPSQLEREEFSACFRASFYDPAFRAEDPSIARLEDIAWQAYSEGRTAAPITLPTGPPAAIPTAAPAAPSDTAPAPVPSG